MSQVMTLLLLSHHQIQTYANVWPSPYSMSYHCCQEGALYVDWILPGDIKRKYGVWGNWFDIFDVTIRQRRIRQIPRVILKNVFVCWVILE